MESIIEKPDIYTLKSSSERYVSMNIFSFIGNQVYNYFKDCPINIKRGEKEIATALQKMLGDNKNSMIVYPLCEHVPDLTFREDIDKISQYLN